MRRHFLALPALGLVLLLAGCGGGTTPTAGSAGAGPQATPGPSGGMPATAPPTPGGTNDDVIEGGFSGPVTAAGTPEDLLSLIPQELCGSKPARYAFTGAEWLQDAQPAALDALAAAGKTPDDVIAAIAITSGGSVCNATIARMKGLTPEQVLAVRMGIGGLAGAKEETVDGLRLWRKDGEMLQTYVYAIDDVLLEASALDDEAARSVLAVLPKP